ncbi:unnamed protein product [Arabidopsis halleri]
MKKETHVEVEEKLAEGRKKVDAELQETLAKLKNQKEEIIKTSFLGLKRTMCSVI